MKNVIKSLAKCVLIPLGLTVTIQKTGIHTNFLGSGTATLIV